MELLAQVKNSMRISHSALDETIKSDIEAGTLDLLRVGIQALKEDGKTIQDNALIYKAIELFCKAQADFEGKGTNYEAAYTRLRDAMSLCGEYR